MKPTDAFNSQALKINPGQQMADLRMYFPLRGRIVGVKFKDGSKGKRTFVDVLPYGGWPVLHWVSLLHGKINADHGEDWTPEVGDEVAVAFFGGNINDPVVIGYLPPPANNLEAAAAEAPRYHRRRSGFDETIDKDGNRTAYTPKDETVTVDGKRTTIIEGNEDVTISSGDLLITVSAGKCTVNIAGKTAWTSNGTIELDGGSGSPKGVVQGDCICPLIKAPHVMRSADVKATLG